jgi:hypothetical protein
MNGIIEGGRRGAPHIPLQKTQKEDFLDFLTNPITPLKEFENDCASFTKFKKGAVT